MRNSRILSIANASNNVNWDVARLDTSTTSAGAVDTDIVTDQTIFPRSKSLGRATNPNTNKGLVHLIHQITFMSRVSSTGVGAAGAFLRFQILRRRLATAALQDIVNPTGLVVYDHSTQKPADYTSTGTIGTLATGAGRGMEVVNFERPIIMVEPYFLVVGGTVAAFGTTIVATINIVRMLVESIRVNGEEYRRILDAYTQIPTTLERSQEQPNQPT